MRQLLLSLCALTSALSPRRYDAAALAAHFAHPAGEAALRSHAASVAGTSLRAAAALAVPGRSDAARRAIEALGPTVIKFGQAAANRPDLVGESLADSLRLLQDSATPFATAEAREIIRADLPREAAAALLDVLPDEPAAAASLGQVYKVPLGDSYAAVKVLRPGSRETVARDAVLARRAATWLEGLRRPGGERLLRPALVAAVDEFFGRMFEEMDYDNERANIDAFGSIYGRGGRAARQLRRSAGGGGELVLPEALPEWSAGRVLSMSWVDGEPLLAKGVATLPASQLPLVRFGIEATLSQMLEEGTMHADPHGGNLLRVAGEAGEASRWRRLWARPPRARLAYLDFGLVSTVPLQVREGLVCAVAYLLFARDVSSVAGLFGELMLLPPSELESPERRRALEEALEQLAASVLVEPLAEETAEGGRSLPTLAFDQLITQLALLAPRFAFELPPYFLNNARAIATLEGMARSADPSFDVLQVVYPFALRRLLADPRASPVLGRTLADLTRGEDGRLDLDRAARLLDEASALSKLPRRKLLLDAARTKGGRAFGRQVARAAVARFGRRAWGAVRGPASVAA